MYKYRKEQKNFKRQINHTQMNRRCNCIGWWWCDWFTSLSLVKCRFISFCKMYGYLSNSRIRKSNLQIRTLTNDCRCSIGKYSARPIAVSPRLLTRFWSAPYEINKRAVDNFNERILKIQKLKKKIFHIILIHQTYATWSGVVRVRSIIFGSMPYSSKISKHLSCPIEEEKY